MVGKPHPFTAAQVRRLREEKGISMMDAKAVLHEQYRTDMDAHIASKISELSPDNPVFDILRLLLERIQLGDES